MEISAQCQTIWEKVCPIVLHVLENTNNLSLFCREKILGIAPVFSVVPRNTHFIRRRFHLAAFYYLIECFEPAEGKRRQIKCVNTRYKENNTGAFLLCVSIENVQQNGAYVSQIV